MTDETFNWTGNTRTDACGCIWRELARTDGTGEPLWFGGRKGEICQHHLDHLAERVDQLFSEGKLSK